ncbi:TIGR03086 family metal-binding protein [Herbiconiux liukaitaii]|uniref:TIGR03086 family metal-binding protein n=1 Tax=Herbiconiux liukaitaii TaxID=3342799 RepID=UPI0035BB68A9
MESQDLITVDPAERHRRIADTFTALVEGVEPEDSTDTSGWDAPTPVEGWRARDVVRHLVNWLPGFLAGGSDVVLLAGPSVDDEPAEAWRVHAAGVQSVLDDPRTAGLMFRHPHVGEMPLADAIDRFYTADVFMHGWDLAIATGQELHLDPAFAAQLLGGMEQMEEVIRASGQYGARVEVPAGASVQERLIGFIGRDPHWAASA